MSNQGPLESLSPWAVMNLSPTKLWPRQCELHHGLLQIRSWVLVMERAQNEAFGSVVIVQLL